MSEAFVYTDEQRARFEAAKREYSGIEKSEYVRSHDDALFGWIDEALRLYSAASLDVQILPELEHKIGKARQIYQMIESRTPWSEVGSTEHPFTYSDAETANNDVGLWVPGYPGFGATDDEKKRFETTKSKYEQIALPVKIARPDLWVNFQWLDQFIKDWRWRRAYPSDVAHFEAEVARIAKAYNEEQAIEPTGFRVGQQVEIYRFNTWLPAVIDKVDDFGFYQVTYEGGMSPTGSHILGSVDPGVRANDLRLATNANQHVRGAIVAPGAGLAGFNVGDTVEMLWFGEWVPAKIEQINRDGKTVTFAVSHGELVSKDGQHKSSAGTVFLVPAKELRKPGDVGWWPGFGPVDEAKRTFELATKRLDELFAWGVAQKLPHRKLTIESVKKYRDAWQKGEAELALLGGYKGDVESLAKEAAEKGFTINGAPLPPVDVESVSAANQTAAAVDNAQKDAAKALEKSAGNLFGSMGKIWSAIPVGYKIGGGVVGVGLLGVGVAAYATQKGKRQ